MMGPRTFSQILRKRDTLNAAWRRIRAHGLRSPSSQTRAEILNFEKHELRNLRRIQDDLLRGRFQFARQVGLRIQRPNKGPRPIVLAAVKNRIVQRALLDVLQREPNILRVLQTPTSFGGIKGRGVEDAARAVSEAKRSGAKYFIKSDIKDFFTKIPRSFVLEEIRELAADADPAFLDLLAQGMETNLENLEELGDDAHLFPLGPEGVAQGSPLSALAGNILLQDFDATLNGRGITCVRFVDDFVILGREPSHVHKAFVNAQRLLSTFNMQAYNAIENPEKAKIGHVDQGFDFLGCHISRGWVLPSASNQNRLLNSLRERLREGRAELNAIARGLPYRSQPRGFEQTLTDVRNVVRGWGDAYHFCNGYHALESFDRKISSEINGFVEFAYRLRIGAAPETRRCMVGVPLLVERHRKSVAA
jgi:RNA-directed DNA polymerase